MVDSINLTSRRVTRAFADLQKSDEALRESEERFRSAFQNVATGSIVIGDTGIIEIFNTAAEEIFGYTADEVIGRNVAMLMPEPDSTRHDEYIRNYRVTGEAKIIGVGRDVEGLRKNGETFPMRLGVGEMRVGGRSSFVSSISDLTEIKALEAKLIHAQKMEAMGLLTGGVAHDFNNLMAIMMGNAELLGDMLADNPQASTCVEDIIQAVERGSSLTQRLLAFSRKQLLSPKETDVSGLVLGLEDMLVRTLGETIELTVISGPDDCIAMIDPSQLELVIINLAVNAKDAMPQGGRLMIETATVTLDEEYTIQRDDLEPGEYIEVAVSDSGTGMAPDILARVFEPFFTTKEVGQGSGLGLSMVFGFAKQSKGHASIYSEIGKGTTVKVFLPRVSSGQGDAQDIRADTSEPKRGHERILVVEDDENVRNIPSAILRAAGYEVVEVVDGAQAIQVLRDKPFDLLFTDVVLPGGMNGVEIAARAKRLLPNIKTLYTTGYTENTVIHNGDLDPGVTLVSKPYRRNELLEKVRALLDSKSDS
jgi:PAS domain S-box-containing protein